MFSKLTWWRSTFDSAVLRLAIVSLLFVISIVPRFYHLAFEEPQPDELHWRARGSEVLSHFKRGDYFHATDNIGHPGVPPALVMAASQNYFQKRADQGQTSIDSLAASRLGCAAVSSLAPVFLYLGFAPIVGTVPSLAAGLFLALDPYHIGASRMAHLDGMLSFLTILTVLCYYRAASRRSGEWFLITGVFWGLSILTKPTAVLLIPAILIWKMIERYGARNSQIKLIDPLDLIVVLVGHLTLGLLFTRLWRHDSDYLHRLNIHSRVADAVYTAGLTLQAYPLITFSTLVIAATVGGSLLLGRSSGPGRKMASDAAIVFTILIAVAASLFVVPQVLENMVRFWCWVLGLSGQTHKAYGEIHLPPLGGYPVLVFSRLPTLTVICFLVGAVWSILNVRERVRRHDHGFSRGSACLLVFVILLVWGGFLSMSSKQALRYLLPALSAAIILAGVGLSEIGVWLFETPVEGQGKIARIRRRLALPVGLVTLGMFFYGIYAARPHYNLYFNSLSGGLKTGVRRQSSMPVVGHFKAVSYLDAKAEEEKRGLTVGVYGDLDLLDYVHDRYFGKRKFPLRFIFSSGLTNVDYLAVFPFARTAVLGSVRDHLIPVFNYSVGGVVFVRLYQVLPFEFEKPFKFPIPHSAHTTGRAKRGGKDSVPAIEVIPGEHKKGFMFGDSVRAVAGPYRVDFKLGLPKGVSPDPALTPDRYVVRLDFGNECNRVITVGELASNAAQSFALNCTAQTSGNKNIRVYWFGLAPVSLQAVEFQKASSPES